MQSLTITTIHNTTDCKSNQSDLSCQCSCSFSGFTLIRVDLGPHVCSHSLSFLFTLNRVTVVLPPRCCCSCCSCIKRSRTRFAFFLTGQDRPPIGVDYFSYGNPSTSVGFPLCKRPLYTSAVDL